MRARATLVLTLSMLTAPGTGLMNISAQPTPEHKKLDYFAGKWRADVDIKASAAAPASKASGTDDCELFANLHVVCRSEATGAAGLYKSMRVISYVPAMKTYASYTVDSIGYALLSLGTVEGNTWTFTTEAGGVKSRFIMKTSSDSYTATSEWAGADGKWTPISQTKSTRMR